MKTSQSFQEGLARLFTVRPNLFDATQLEKLTGFLNEGPSTLAGKQAEKTGKME